MYYNRFLLMADPVGGAPGNPPANEPPAGGDFVDTMVAEMNAASKGTEPPPAGSPPAPAPAAPAPAPAAKAPEPPKPAAPAAKAPAPAPKAPQQPAAPAPKPAAPAAKPAAPVGEPKLDWNSAPQQFRAAHEKLVQVHQQETTRLSTELQTTQAKMRELEGKKFLSPDQEQHYAKLEKDQQNLQAELYARDYRESPEFKSKYEEKSKAIFTRVGTNLKSLQVDDGQGNMRPAVMSDFQKILNLGDNPIEQRRAAKAMFGEDADVILSDARELQSNVNQANEEIDAKRKGYHTEREKQQQQFQRELEEGKQTFAQYDGLLETKFPQYFGPIEGNDEYNKAREEGLKYIDSVVSTLNTKPTHERAFQTALMRRWAAVFPASQILLKQRDEKIASLQSEIAKLKGTDPGELGDGGGGGGGGGEELGGTDTLTAEIDAMVKGN